MRARESELRPESDAVAEAGLCLLGCDLLRQRLGFSISASQEEEVARALGVEPARAREEAARLRALLEGDERAGTESERLRLEIKLLRYFLEHQDSAGERIAGSDDLHAFVRP